MLEKLRQWKLWKSLRSLRRSKGGLYCPATISVEVVGVEAAIADLDRISAKVESLSQQLERMDELLATAKELARQGEDGETGAV